MKLEYVSYFPMYVKCWNSFFIFAQFTSKLQQPIRIYDIVFITRVIGMGGWRIFFSYDIFVHGSKCQFIDGINLNLTHVCVCCEIIFVFTYISFVVFVYKVKQK